VALGLAYEIKSTVRAGRPVTFARWWCAQCGAHEDITINAASKHNPESYARFAANHGWSADAFKKRQCICPKCLDEAAQRKAVKKGENVVKLSAVNDINPAARKPSPEEKARIRAKLDALFDDSKGLYLDSASDQTIGRELDLPWAWVQQVREAAYGPLRVDPELAALKAQIEQAQKIADEAVRVAQEAAKHVATALGAVADHMRKKGLVAR